MTESELLPVLRRWWWVLLLGIVVAAAGGYALSSTAAKTYQAQVVLLVGPVNGSVDLDASGGLARTYADLATSAPVLRKALLVAGDPRTVADIQDDVSTSSNAITRIVTISVNGHDPRAAARLANDIGDRLKKLANTTPPQSIDALDEFSHQSELAPLSGDERDGVLTAATRIFGASQTGEVSVVQAASTPQLPAGPAVVLMTLLAALAGACLAAFGVFVLELRERIRQAPPASAGIAPTPLAVIDAVRDAPSPGLVEAGLESDCAESYRMLATRAQLLAPRARPVAVLVVDSGDGSAAATVAANLAAAVAGERRHVILADLDPPGPGVSDLLGLEHRFGYTNIVGDTAPGSGADDRLHQALVRRDRWLRVLPRGTTTLPSVRSAARISSLLERLRKTADVIVLAGPPLTRSSKVIAWARAVDQVCLVVDSSAPGDEVQRVVVGLERLDGAFVNAVLRWREGSPRRHDERLRAS